MNDYQQYIALSRYARWLPEESRRETWPETVERYVNYFSWELGQFRREVYDAIVNLEVMPSMRCLMTAGAALDKDNVAGYNCAYAVCDDPRFFDEVMYILMCGTGVGFSVERQYVSKLPIVSEEFYKTDTTIRVSDSKLGWATAFRELISLLYMGKIPRWDLTRVRPKGAPLKTFGGRASGPEPLEELFRNTVRLFEGAKGRRLTSLECHDLTCRVASAIVVGGVRRSALISLSNFSDQRMAGAKSGDWWTSEPQRSLSNNSAAYTERPDYNQFLKEWVGIYESKSGERGIFNRVAARKQASKTGRRDPAHEWGTNPCSEIILRPFQFCNLSEVIVRRDDDLESLKRKVRIATILGTIQATRTNFRYLRAVWKNNCEEERLLGVSLTGIKDNAKLSAIPGLPAILEELKSVAIATNKEWSKGLKINMATSITCVKPSGTVSQLVDSSSGIHARYSDYYIRRVRSDAKDPITSLLVEQGVPYEVDVTNPHNYVFSFPHKSPEGAVTTVDEPSLYNLRLWKIYQDHWCEHKPSMTYHYKDSEFLKVGQWIWENWDDVSGITFLPYDDHIYQQAPYEQIAEDQYEELLAAMPTIDWTKLSDYEKEDRTTSAKELACTGGACEL